MVYGFPLRPSQELWPLLYAQVLQRTCLLSLLISFPCTLISVQEFSSISIQRVYYENGTRLLGHSVKKGIKKGENDDDHVICVEWDVAGEYYCGEV